ncbi:hypothetical protein [Helicobacter sp. 11S02629-2]|uniref:hypothetical protein n=1 Tax=Helicobacter sp. 11S02629-2 TaxID=1476195 RepID=UPI000BA7427B|nr:hypothetical protein [Helicobacter sp. 11S02629-2]PAF44159.1 hypothetical protein BKH40_06070 [Helicobacter sp. 11S02629-2]
MIIGAVVIFVLVTLFGGLFKLLAFLVNGGGEKIAKGFSDFDKSISERIKIQNEKLKMPIDKNAPLQWKDFNDVGTRTGRLAYKLSRIWLAFCISIPVIIATVAILSK